MKGMVKSIALFLAVVTVKSAIAKSAFLGYKMNIDIQLMMRELFMLFYTISINIIMPQLIS